jgi:Mrp family chromosome partitioning ATPase
VDTPALLTQPEGAGVAAHADVAVLVLDARHARKRTAEPALGALQGVGTRILGVVLNRVSDGQATDAHALAASTYQPGTTAPSRAANAAVDS